MTIKTIIVEQQSLKPVLLFLNQHIEKVKSGIPPSLFVLAFTHRGFKSPSKIKGEAHNSLGF
jgi:hypothetical protein